MKRIEDIENLSIEELEQAAQGAPVPEGLAERLQSALAAETFLQGVEKEPSGAFLSGRGRPLSFRPVYPISLASRSASQMSSSVSAFSRASLPRTASFFT